MRKLGTLMSPWLTKGDSPALLFDGSQNYVDIGTLGTLGSSISANNGFYCSVDFKVITVVAGGAMMGVAKIGNLNSFRIFINSGGVSGKIRINLYDAASKKVDGFFTNVATVNGKKHTLTIQITPSTNVIVATLDGASQTITYTNQDTPNGFIDFTHNMLLACNNNNGSASNFSNIVLDNIKFGTSIGVLFASYAMNEGTGTTIADSVGSNTGTLTGSPLPTWTTMS